MTARDRLNRKKRPVAILVYFTFAIFLLGFLFSIVFPAFVVVGFWGFGIFYRDPRIRLFRHSLSGVQGLLGQTGHAVRVSFLHIEQDKSLPELRYRSRCGR